MAPIQIPEDSRFRPHRITREEAIKRLTRRYNEQSEKYPLMAKDVPLALYLKRNLPSVLASPLANPMAKYAK
jgi:hypothetical protein